MDETNGGYLAVLFQNAVSLRPYLERLQKIFLNQYCVVFQAPPGEKDGLTRVDISTNLADTDIAFAENVWVSAN